jgi:hypothetical protein
MQPVNNQCDISVRKECFASGPGGIGAAEVLSRAIPCFAPEDLELPAAARKIQGPRT